MKIYLTALVAGCIGARSQIYRSAKYRLDIRETLKYYYFVRMRILFFFLISMVIEINLLTRRRV